MFVDTRIPIGTTLRCSLTPSFDLIGSFMQYTPTIFNTVPSYLSSSVSRRSVGEECGFFSASKTNIAPMSLASKHLVMFPFRTLSPQNQKKTLNVVKKNMNSPRKPPQHQHSRLLCLVIAATLVAHSKLKTPLAHRYAAVLNKREHSP